MSEISEQQLIDVFASTTGNNYYRNTIRHLFFNAFFALGKFAKIVVPYSGVPIPLIAERLQVIREAGTTLIEVEVFLFLNSPSQKCQTYGNLEI